MDADLVILAGNIDRGDAGVRWALRHFSQPVLYILGVSEYFGLKLERVPPSLKELCKGSNVKILNEKAKTFDQFRFIGATLWTDYRLLGTQVSSATLAAANCEEFRTIQKDRPKSHLPITPDDLIKTYIKSLKFICKSIKDARKEKLKPIVLSHHGPLPSALPPSMQSHLLAPAMASDLSEEIRSHKPKLWVHGHTGITANYQHAKTQILSNARWQPDGELNPAFDAGMIVEI
ncbi:metallophosphoesterase family protein [Corallincola platygyrae]